MVYKRILHSSIISIVDPNDPNACQQVLLENLASYSGCDEVSWFAAEKALLIVFKQFDHVITLIPTFS